MNLKNLPSGKMVKLQRYGSPKTMRARIFISFTALALIFFWLSRTIEWNDLVGIWGQADSDFISSALLCSLFFPFIGTHRWRCILGGFNTKIPWNFGFRAVMIASSVNLLAPAKSGDLVKVLVSGKTKRKEVLLSAVICERINDLLVLGALSALSGYFLGKNIQAMVGTVVLVAIFVGVIFVYNFKWSTVRLRQEYLNKVLMSFYRASCMYIENPIFILKTLTLSLLNWTLAIIQIWFLFRSFDVPLSVLQIAMLFPLTVIITTVPITFGGVGVREAAYMYLFANFAEPYVCFNVSMMYFLFNNVLVGACGSICFHRYITERRKTF